MSGSFAKLWGAGGGTPPIWLPNSPAETNQLFTSALDREVYRWMAVSSANTGATDPADDTGFNWDAVTFRKTRLISPLDMGSQSTANSGEFAVNAKKSSMGSLVGNTRTLVFSATGRGALAFLGFCPSQSSTPMANLRVEITVDGRSVYNAQVTGNTPGAIAVVGTPGLGAGFNTYTGGGLAYESPDPVEFRRSLAVHVTVSTAISNSAIATILRGR